MDKEREISSIYKILILYEEVEKNKCIEKLNSYLNYLDRLYVYWLGNGKKEIYEIIRGLWALGINAGHKRVKSMVFHMIDIIKKGSV
jgi:hypothetical protein